MPIHFDTSCFLLQWNQGSLRPVAVLSLAAAGPQDGIQQRPKDAAEAGGEPQAGRNGTGAGGAAHIAVIQPHSGTAHQGQGNGAQNARQLTVFYYNKVNGLKSLLRTGI